MIRTSLYKALRIVRVGQQALIGSAENPVAMAGDHPVKEIQNKGWEKFGDLQDSPWRLQSIEDEQNSPGSVVKPRGLRFVIRHHIKGIEIVGILPEFHQ